MKCLLKYPWVKLPRDRVPGGKGLMGSWMRLAARAAFRKGEGHYCGYDNPVEPGMWVSGVVGLKSILGIRRRDTALDALQCLAELGFLSWSLDPSTKKLGYSLSDWLVRFSGAECPDGAVYTTEGYGFVCVSREITQRLIDKINERIMAYQAERYRGAFSRNIYEDNLVFAYFAPITTILYRQWVKDNKKMPLEDLIATATRLVCGGLGEYVKG